MRLTRLVPLYAVLVLLLAAAGSHNQALFRKQARLIDEKANLHAQIVELRALAAETTGPLAVGAWARTHGMLPAPEVDQVRHVAPFPAPQPVSFAAGLEVRTVWQ